MKNFKFIISYDGSRYFGWERQPGRDTIQGKLEAVLTRMCGTDVQDIGAGRTDAGVHAKAMAANAYMDTERTPDEVRDYMNRYLPDDICVQEAKLAADRFHARYRAVGKAMGVTGIDEMNDAEAADATIAAVKKLSADVGIPADLKGILKEEDVQFLAESAFADACCPGNPRDTNVEEIKELYRSLM